MLLRSPNDRREPEPRPYPRGHAPAAAVSPADARREKWDQQVRDLHRVGPRARLPLSGGAVSNVDLDGFTQLLERDAIRPIYRPLVVDAAEADLVADELVLGVQIGGEARAYPVGTLRFREIVNDVLGDTPILVTW